MSSIDELVARVGVQRHWSDVHGQAHAVAEEDIRDLLGALGFPADTEAAVGQSLERFDALDCAPPPLVTCVAGEDVVITGATGRYQWKDERGEVVAEGHMANGGRARAPALPGYFDVESGNAITRVAIAPLRRPQTRWTYGVAAQLYGLRKDGDGGIGDFSGLGALVHTLGARGADAVALSPVHAMFASDPAHSSPYSPSSRLHFNTLHVDPAHVHGDTELRSVLRILGAAEEWEALERAPLIDWRAAGTLRQRVLRALHQRARSRGGDGWNAFLAWRRIQPADLELHARFEALHACSDLGRDWRQWPPAWRDANGAAVMAFAEEHAADVEFHCYAQWLAVQGLAAAQRGSREAGMRIGLIADLAVGCDPSGSEAWGRADTMPQHISVGAPPDLLAPQGQSWGLTTYSPVGLQRQGYRPFLDLVRASLAHAGAVRIDHVIGMQRLWLTRQGAQASRGAYVCYPREDLLRLLALEAWRHDALIIGEDLGTVPEGFRDRLAGGDVLGMSVLMFERDGDAFRPLCRWRTDALAMTSTHDLPTLAGWWQGRDIAWRRELALIGDDEQSALEWQRGEDRQRLLDRVGEDAGLAPAVAEQTGAGDFVDAALAHVARAPVPLVIVPLEDVLGEEEQPNLPGTTTGHPNWRRRLTGTVDDITNGPDVDRRLQVLQQLRRRIDRGDPP